MSAWNDSIKETQPRSSTRGRNSYILTIIRGRGKRAGYRIEIVYLRLDSVQLALRRIAARGRQGGHHVLLSDVIRRFKRGWANFETVYRPMAESWAVYDNSGATPLLLERKI